ncbi:MAG: TolC family protein [Bacteroidetes bacterium]|nr:TolC family protein [Bacteroidota bacterium]
MRKYLIFTLILTWAIGISAQENVESIRLTVDKALSYAMENNPQIHISKLGIDNAEAQYYEALGRFMPGINASGSYMRNLKNPVIFMPDGPPFFGQVLEIGSENSYNAGFSANLPIYNAAIIATLNATKVQKEIAEEQYRAAKIDLQYNVKMAFYNSLLAKESYDIMLQRFENAQKNLNNIKLMQRQGMVSEFDLLRAEVSTENLHPSVLQTENFYNLAVNHLKVLIGFDKNVEIELDSNIFETAKIMMNDVNLLQSQRSLSQNTNLLQLDLQRALLNKQVKTIKASNLPSVTAIGNYQFQTQTNNFDFADYNWVQTSAIGLQINIPVFNGFTVRNRARQVQIAGEQIALQREYLEDNLKVQLDDIFKTMSLAIEKSANAEKNVKLAERAYNIALTRYNSGQGTLLEVNDSEMAMAQAKFNLLQATHEILKAKTDYDKFVGESSKLQID